MCFDWLMIVDPQDSAHTARITLEQVDGLNLEEGLDRCVNDRGMLGSILLEFAAKFGPSTQQIGERITQGRWVEAEFLVHSVKGTSGLIGLLDLYAVASDLDTALKVACDAGQSSPELEAKFDRYKRVMNRLLNCIGRLDQQAPGARMNESRITILDAGAVRQALTESAALIASLSEQADALVSAAAGCVAALKAGGKILTAGNGGSAAEALHMAEELTGRFRGNRVSLPAVSLVADCTALTCIANDYGYDYVFSRQIEGLGKPGDVLVLFSTSGNAVNLEKALVAAQAKGMKTLILIGKSGGRLKGRADWEIHVKGEQTERIQEAHQVILHLILEAVERAFPPGSSPGA